MISPINQAPPQFLRRYQRIQSGEEAIDTVAKLKDFWLFAIAQGEGHREMREHIAELVLQIKCRKNVRDLAYNLSREGRTDMVYALVTDEWASMARISNFCDPQDGSKDEECYDSAWNNMRHWIEMVDEKKLDKYLYPFGKSV